MPLQNRVDPFGTIQAVSARGLFTGNRGVIHDPDTKTLLKRRWTTKAWILCRCAFGNRRREPMGRNAPSGSAGWTELFFLDEPTALAAGHRPCFYCRREAARSFADAFARGLGRSRIPAPEMDAILHTERLASMPAVPLRNASSLERLTDGVMVAAEGKAFAVRNKHLLPWSFSGYGAPLPMAGMLGEGLRLITPPATCAALAAGFAPVWHPTAG